MHRRCLVVSLIALAALGWGVLLLAPIRSMAGPTAAPRLSASPAQEVSRIRQAVARVDPNSLDAAERYRLLLQDLLRVSDRNAAAAADLRARLVVAQQQSQQFTVEHARAEKAIADREATLAQLKDETQFSAALLQELADRDADIEARAAAETRAKQLAARLAEKEKLAVVNRAALKTLRAALAKHTPAAGADKGDSKALLAATAAAASARQQLRASQALNDALLDQLQFAAAPPPAKRPATAPKQLDSRLQRAELLAGLVPLEGPGLIITLRDSPRKPQKPADKRNFQVHEQDLNGLLTSLKIAGAEAIAVGAAATAEPVRVTATTAARQLPGALLINGRRFKQPYRIYVIGDQTALRAELKRPGGVIANAGLDVLQMIVIQNSNRVVVPAARPSQFRLARVVGQAGKPLPPAAARPKASAVPPPTRPAAPRTARAPVPAPTRGDGPRFAGRNLPRYHRPGCRFGERLPANQRVRYANAAAALAAGKRPCEYCHPEAPKPAARR